ncbi:MAG: YunC family protein [Anaerolineae bacterium]
MGWNMQIKSVEVSAGTALGVRIGNPQSPEKAMVIVLIGEKGIIVCRNFDIAALEQRGVAAARVQGITSFEEVLTAPIESCTAQARQLGVMEGMKGEDALIRFL